MAEFVQQSIEEMLPELEQMERVGLFTAKETKAMLKKRSSFEYKLRRRTKLKEDYLQYIQYEMHVLALLKKRREREGYHFKKEEIEFTIMKRINKFFKLAIFRFQNDVELWLSHIEFCKKKNEKTNVSKIYSKMLQVHNRNPGLWVAAAKWEIEIQNSMENARSLLQRGLRFNNDSKDLWLEYFRMELLNSDKHRKRQEILGIPNKESEEAPDFVKTGMVALLVYNKAVEAIPDDVSFSLSFLPIIRLFKFAQHIEDHILKRLEAVSPLDEALWEARARCFLDALPNVIKDPELSKNEKVQKITVAEREFCKIFDEAVEKIQSEKIRTLYISSLLKMLEEKVPSQVINGRVLVTLDVFGRAHDAGLLTEDLYLEWITVLQKVGLVDKASEVSQHSVQKYPKSVPLWKQQLLILMSQDATSYEPVFNAVSQALKSVKDKKSLPLWQLITEWYIIHEPEEVESVFEMGLTKCTSVCKYVKYQYLLWAAFTKSIIFTRDLYKRLTELQPISLDFYQQYIKLENSQIEVKIKYIRKAYEEASDRFGKSNPELWIDYIKVELNHPQGDPQKVGNIHWRAMQTLDESGTEQFTMMYTLLQTGHEL